MLHELIKKNRSYRRFHQEVRIEQNVLRELVDGARLCPSAANKQPLKYVLVSDPDVCREVFPCLAWAGYLKNWPSPKEGERPSAYIIILSDRTLNPKPHTDVGIAAQTILLGAVEKGYGGCLIGSIRRKQLQQILGLPEHLEIELVTALGKPKETVEIETVEADDDIKYWRDEREVHHVPKRRLEDIIIGQF